MGKLLELNEECFTYLMFLTSPGDACRWCSVSKPFKTAVDSDALWEKFLPSGYEELFSESLLNDESITKKKMYLMLVESYVLMRGDNTSMSLNKQGKRSFFVGAKELSIAWRNDPRHWKWVPDTNSRFGQIIQLESVCWLQIRCKWDSNLLSPQTRYTVYVRMKHTDTNVYGLAHPPGMSCIKFDEQATSTCCRVVYFDHDLSRRARPHPRQHRHDLMRRYMVPTHMVNGERATPNDYRFPVSRGDGWMEVEIGEFYNDKGDDGIIDLSAGETKFLHWKSGLIVEGIEIRAQ